MASSQNGGDLSLPHFDCPVLILGIRVDVVPNMQQDPKVVIPSGMDIDNTTRDRERELHDKQMGHSVPVIMTPSVFNFMDLPGELRIQVCVVFRWRSSVRVSGEHSSHATKSFLKTYTPRDWLKVTKSDTV